MASESLERFINRKRLFVRVQANVQRELFVQKLNTAFPGARIGVGNANAERGQQVTQRVADINYDSSAEACQALRRNRFKLKVGNHDADITYQIERKDVVEKLAGEWGCRFMVVVKNLPTEVSCAELSDMFETAGEIFTIKILPGNRGEPYALVQYVEEQSVDTSIQQINQQKLRGSVLYVERHLKARRQGGSSSSQSSAAPPPNTPPASSPSPTSSVTQSQPQQPTSSLSSTASSLARATSAAAAVAGVPVPVLAAAPQTARTIVPPISTSQTQQSAAQPGLQPASPVPQAQQQSHHHAQQQQQAVTHVLAPPSLSSPVMSPTGQSAMAHPSHPGGMPHLGTAPATPSTQQQPPQSVLDSSNSLFSTQYILPGKQEGLTSQYSMNGGTPSQPSDSRLNVFSNDLSSVTGNSMGMPSTAASPSSLMGSAAAVGGPSLRTGLSVPAPGLGVMGHAAAGLGALGTTGSTASVLNPMLDLFSHLREPAGPQSSGGSLLPQHHDSLSNGGAGINGNGMHGCSTGGSSSGMGGYAGMLLRSSPGAPTPSTPGGGMLSPSGPSNGMPGLTSASSLGSQMGGPAGHSGMLSGGGARMTGQSTPPQPLSLNTQMSGQGLQAGPGLASPVAQQQQQFQQQQQQQHSVAVAAAAAANLGLARISIRDSLRLALGRLEEMVTCPITGEIMHDPVVAADGYSYERAAIQAWMSAHNVSPLSGEVLQHKMLTLNRLAKDIIADIMP